MNKLSLPSGYLRRGIRLMRRDGSECDPPKTGQVPVTGAVAGLIAPGRRALGRDNSPARAASAAAKAPLPGPGQPAMSTSQPWAS